ncbi:MAG: hypothetical protein JWQ01_680 [Massilia sp.]|nr:hypothetical protein [Massilia sp.]
MKIMKNFEAAFVAAAVVATFASYATARESAYVSPAPVAAIAAAANAPMQVVVIKGQRLTAAEKAKLDA